MDRTHPTLYIVALVIASVLLVVIAAPIPFLIIELKVALGYLIIAIAGFKMGFLSCVLIEHFTVKEKKEIIAGVIIPLPASIALYAGFAVLDKMKQVFVTLEADPTIASLFAFQIYSPAVATGILFMFFNIPFLYYFYKKQEDSSLLYYYMLAPVVIATAAIIINTILQVVFG